MKIKSIAAVGALSAGLGIAGFIGAGTASADDCSTAPPPANPSYTLPLTPARVACVTNEQLAEFARTTSPQYNIDVLLNGQNETAGDPSTNTGLGLKDQLGTFQSSVGDFLNGPRSPDPAPESGSGF